MLEGKRPVSSDHTDASASAEVMNPGYPGAFLVLGIPVIILGLVSVLALVIHGPRSDPAFGGGIGARIGATLGSLIWPGITLLLGISLVLAGVRARRAQKRAACVRDNVCFSCGYEKEGLANDAVCPECGAAPEAKRPECGGSDGSTTPAAR